MPRAQGRQCNARQLIALELKLSNFIEFCIGAPVAMQRTFLPVDLYGRLYNWIFIDYIILYMLLLYIIVAMNSKVQSCSTSHSVRARMLLLLGWEINNVSSHGRWRVLTCRVGILTNWLRAESSHRLSQGVQTVAV